MTNPLTFIVAGQSNAVSPSDNVPGFPPVVSATARVFLTHTYDTEIFSARTSTPLCPARASSCWTLLGDVLASRLDRDIHFINVAHGATSSTAFRQLYRAELLLAVSHHPAAILWIQGESDEHVQTTDGIAALSRLIGDSRTVSPNLPWFTALNGFARPAHLHVIQNNLALPGPDIDWIRRYHPEAFDPSRAEFARQGHATHANAWIPFLSRLLPGIDSATSGKDPGRRGDETSLSAAELYRQGYWMPTTE